MLFPYSEKISSISQTKKLASLFSKVIQPGNLIILNGNLGSGKTTFIKLLCANFNIDNVSSPSFSIVNEYSGDVQIYHFDFYRLKSSMELFDIGFEEYLNNENSIIFIEWGELFPEVLPKHFFEINIEFMKEIERKIIISKHD